MFPESGYAELFDIVALQHFCSTCTGFWKFGFFTLSALQNFHGYLKIVARRRVKVRFEKYGGVGNEMVEGFCRKIFKTVRMEYLAFETWKISIAIFIISKRYIHIFSYLRPPLSNKMETLMCMYIYIYLTFSIIVIWNCGTKYDSTLEIEIKT